MAYTIQYRSWQYRVKAKRAMGLSIARQSAAWSKHPRSAAPPSLLLVVHVVIIGVNVLVAVRHDIAITNMNTATISFFTV